MQIALLKEVVVSGSRNEQSVEDIPQTIDVINATDIEQGQIRDIRDAAKNIPNVSVRRAPARFGLAQGDTGREGNAGFNIRGLERTVPKCHGGWQQFRQAVRGLLACYTWQRERLRGLSASGRGCRKLYIRCE